MEMSPELKRIMQRRRKKADTISDEEEKKPHYLEDVPPPPPPPPPPPSHPPQRAIRSPHRSQIGKRLSTTSNNENEKSNVSVVPRPPSMMTSPQRKGKKNISSPPPPKSQKEPDFSNSSLDRPNFPPWISKSHSSGPIQKQSNHEPEQPPPPPPGSPPSKNVIISPYRSSGKTFKNNPTSYSNSAKNKEFLKDKKTAQTSVINLSSANASRDMQNDNPLTPVSKQSNSENLETSYLSTPSYSPEPSTANNNRHNHFHSPDYKHPHQYYNYSAQPTTSSRKHDSVTSKFLTSNSYSNRKNSEPPVSSFPLGEHNKSNKHRGIPNISNNIEVHSNEYDDDGENGDDRKMMQSFIEPSTMSETASSVTRDEDENVADHSSLVIPPSIIFEESDVIVTAENDEVYGSSKKDNNDILFDEATIDSNFKESESNEVSDSELLLTGNKNDKFTNYGTQVEKINSYDEDYLRSISTPSPRSQHLQAQKNMGINSLKSRVQSPPQHQVSFFSYPLPISRTLPWSSTSSPFHPKPNPINEEAPLPVFNPLTGNLILIRKRKKMINTNNFTTFDAVLDEVDPTNGSIKCSTKILSTDFLQRYSAVEYSRMASNRNVTEETIFRKKKEVIVGISKVISLAAGLHRYQGHSRLKVAVVLDLLICDSPKSSTSTSSFSNNYTTKLVIGVWHWGYTLSRPIAIQSVLAPPDAPSRNVSVIHTTPKTNHFDPYTICLADGVIFLGGFTVIQQNNNSKGRKAQKIACVYFTKPHLREPWSCVHIHIPNNDNRPKLHQSQKDPEIVTALSVTTNPNRLFKYLAIAADDGSVSIWKYDLAASTNRLSRHESRGFSQENLIQPLCRLNGASLFDSVQKSIFVGMKTSVSISGDTKNDKSNFNFERCCTHLAWIGPGYFNSSSLTFLAAAFTDGVAIYAISLPINNSNINEPSEQATGSVKNMRSSSNGKIAQVIQSIDPVAIAKADLSSIYKNDSSKDLLFRPGKAMVAWTDLGPTFPPCITALFQSRCYESGLEKNMCLSRIFVGILNFDPPGRLHIKRKIENQEPQTLFCLWENNAFNSFSTSVSGIVPATTIGSICCQKFEEDELWAISLCLINDINDSVAREQSSHQILRSKDCYFWSLHHAVASQALGVDHVGNPLNQEEFEDHNCIFHVFSETTSNRMKTSSSNKATTHVGWRFPIQRHWLCRTVMGDKKPKVGFYGSIEKNEKKYSDDRQATGGASTTILTDLTCFVNPTTSLTPRRIANETNNSLLIVLFSPTIGSGESLIEFNSNEKEQYCSIIQYPIAFCIFDKIDVPKSLNSNFTLHHGRDVAFMPRQYFSRAHIIVLSRDGSSVYSLVENTEKANDSSDTFSRDGYEIIPTPNLDLKNSDAIDWYRIFPLISKSFQLLFVGMMRAARCTFITVGSRINTESNELNPSNVLSLLLPKEGSPTLKLEAEEEVVSLVCLPNPPYTRDDSTSSLALATQFRVMIISAQSMVILSSISAKLTSNALVPIGSHCVSFCSVASSNGGGSPKIRYLSCLNNEYSTGTIATLPNSKYGYASNHLMCIRPDRFLYLSCHSGSRSVETDDEMKVVRVPIPITRPLFLLEPLIINALCQHFNDGFDIAGNSNIQTILRALIDKYGRRKTSYPHREAEGIGLEGAGITAKIFEILNAHGCFQASSFLLSGRSSYDPQTPHKVLPPWIPMQAKIKAVSSGKELRNILVSGDESLTDYVHNPKSNTPALLLDSSSPSSLTSYELGIAAMKNGQIMEALEFFDLAGNKYSERLLIDLVLASQLDPTFDTESILQDIVSDSREKNEHHSNNVARDTYSAISFLALDLKQREKQNRMGLKEGECNKVDENLTKTSLIYLAPSLRRGRSEKRIRDHLIKNSMMLNPNTIRTKEDNDLWSAPQNDAHHMWQAGPFQDKEELLLLEDIDEWFGRRQPTIIGKEGLAFAEDTGEKKLADILYAATIESNEGNNSFDSGQIGDVRRNDWVGGIGEGRKDEDNLSAYFRFSEGDSDEDNNWTTEGILDLTKHAHKAMIYGNEAATLEPTTSSVDEGVRGKTKLLYDLVYNEKFDSHRAAGLAISVKRGSSLDVGIFHDHRSRQRSSIEMWYYLPEKENVYNEVILMRRTLSSDGIDMSKLSCSSARDQRLWELAVLSTGQLQFRTNGGSIVTTGGETNAEEKLIEQESKIYFDDDDDNDTFVDPGLVSWQEVNGYGGWNHVCIIFTPCAEESVTEVNVAIIMKGVQVVSSAVSIILPGFEMDQYSDYDIVDKVMHRTILLFGLAPMNGFRMTEIRAWSCARSVDDIKLMRYEYLSPAETKRKIKLKIRVPQSSPLKPAKLTKLSLPQSEKSGRATPRSRARSQLKKLTEKSEESEVNPESTASKKVNDKDFADFTASFIEFNEPSVQNTLTQADANRDKTSSQLSSTAEFQMFSELNAELQSNKNSTFFHSEFEQSNKPTKSIPKKFIFDTVDSINNIKHERNDISDDVSATSILSLSFEASTTYLSSEVRSSAAAAIIRGPPATRHFGGNKGGLITSVRKWKRKKGKEKKVCSIAISGTEKTVIYSYGSDSPGKTYQIGASGAIISDYIGSDEKEYLCCFLAKEKRLSVFDLTNRTIIVELQMKTKLNFWRCLPEETHCKTLVFALITPIGGFHWMPLEDPTRPKLIWRRGDKLEGRKIISYEEGGSNGSLGSHAKPLTALLLVSSVSQKSPIEVWCVPLAEHANSMCISTVALGAAFFCPPKVEKDWLFFYPLVCKVTENEEFFSSEKLYMLEIEKLRVDENDLSILGSETVQKISFSISKDMMTSLAEPIMATGSYPHVLILCLEHVIVLIFRRYGIVMAFLYNGEDSIVKLGRKKIDHYVVDASIKRGDVKGEIQLILLLSLPNKSDGYIAEIQISQVGALL